MAAARPAGPCHGYPNADTWIDRPYAPDVVLIGDAAGHNDPTIGQGVSIAFRDVRLVSEAMAAHDHWTPEIFEPYAAERRRRMARLRTTAQQFSKYRCEYTEGAQAKRRQAAARLAKDPSLSTPFRAVLMGPDLLPPWPTSRPSGNACSNSRTGRPLGSCSRPLSSAGTKYPRRAG